MLVLSLDHILCAQIPQLEPELLCDGMYMYVYL